MLAIGIKQKMTPLSPIVSIRYRHRKTGRFLCAGLLLSMLFMVCVQAEKKSEKTDMSVPFPFFARIKLDADGKALETLTMIFPAVKHAVDRLTESEKLIHREAMQEIRLVGFPTADTIHLCLFIYGNFDTSTALSDTSGTSIPVVTFSGVPIYRAATEPSPGPPVFFSFPKEGLFIAGKKETLKRILETTTSPDPPPILNAFSDESEKLLFYMHQRVLSTMMGGQNIDSSYKILKQFFSGVNEAAIALSPDSGRCRMILVCRTGKDASNLAILFRNFILLTLLESGTEKETADILEGCRIMCDGRQIHASITIPPHVLKKLF